MNPVPNPNSIPLLILEMSRLSASMENRPNSGSVGCVLRHFLIIASLLDCLSLELDPFYHSEIQSLQGYISPICIFWDLVRCSLLSRSVHSPDSAPTTLSSSKSLMTQHYDEFSLAKLQLNFLNSAALRERLILSLGRLSIDDIRMEMETRQLPTTRRILTVCKSE